jgi:DNA-binding CsgD family transcriptional regulator
LYRGLDASRDVSGVESALRALNAPVAQRRPRRPTFGWDSLTVTERRVVALVAEGLTNRQIGDYLFVSRRTVASHLEHVFQKLGHANRVELTAEAVRRLPVAPRRTAPTGSAGGRASPRTP